MPHTVPTPVEIDRNLRLVGSVRAWLAAKQVAQADVAVTVGVSESTLSRWLDGTQAISGGHFVQIADALGVSPGALIGHPTGAQHTQRLQGLIEAGQRIGPRALAALTAVARLLAARG